MKALITTRTLPLSGNRLASYCRVSRIMGPSRKRDRMSTSSHEWHLNVVTISALSLLPEYVPFLDYSRVLFAS